MRSFVIVTMMAFVLPATAVAQSATEVCFRHVVQDCGADQKCANEPLEDRLAKDCDIELLRKDVGRYKAAVKRLEQELDDLRKSSASYEVKLKKIEELKADLDEELAGNGKFQQMMNDALAVSESNFTTLLDIKIGALREMYDNVEARQVETEKKIEEIWKRLHNRRTRLVVDIFGAMTTSADSYLLGMLGVLLPLGDEGFWSFIVEFGSGMTKIHDESGVAYAAETSIRYNVVDWVSVGGSLFFVFAEGGYRSFFAAGAGTAEFRFGENFALELNAGAGDIGFQAGPGEKTEHRTVGFGTLGLKVLFF